jgi:hypothetical protein
MMSLQVESIDIRYPDERKSRGNNGNNGTFIVVTDLEGYIYCQVKFFLTFVDCRPAVHLWCRRC